ncbi:NAD(P)-binding protein [Delitschia confertaspora ATCC 74209]|uniref:Peroxisomal trans-2-enoyl-CoA reductase n=1 Tax=Delitschia confertaspora ATCC 74209 TaxID=1513339 RepID=A0A9P4JPW4_9PLEO|nr:NAD(P)-binding protein [Delitschia confertaspora ATCC 74209]
MTGNNVNSTQMMDEWDCEHFSPYRSDGKLYGFVCVVTSSTQPIGKAIVNELAAHGAACIYACCFHPSSPPTSFFDEINTKHPNTKIIPYPVEITSEEDTLALIDEVLNQWGRLDVFTLLPTTPGPSTISTTTSPTILSTLEHNTLPAFYALKRAPAAMQKTLTQKGNYPNAAPKPVSYGSIIVVNTMGGTGISANNEDRVKGEKSVAGPAFTMASHAVLGVVKSGVSVLRGTGVRINCISAGWIDDGSEDGREKSKQVNGLDRPGRPEEIGRVAGFLASGFSSFMTGANLVVDGGASAVAGMNVPV